MSKQMLMIPFTSGVENISINMSAKFMGSSSVKTLVIRLAVEVFELKESFFSKTEKMAAATNRSGV